MAVAHPIKIASLTILALVSFAANSVLCRLALGSGAIDAASFTVIRMISGIFVLWIIVLARKRNSNPMRSGSWRGAGCLFLYAVAFSYAYLLLETGTGALILFGSVQLSMLVVTLISGVRLGSLEWGGLSVAIGGFAYLMLPGAEAPSFSGFILMATAGVAWAGYTLIGKGSKHPLQDTYANFVRTAPMLLPLLGVMLIGRNITFDGVVFAALSGGLASGVGYAFWYAALKGLSGLQAGVLQLLVPVIAALGGVVIVSEPLSERLVIASLLILGGILAVVLAGQRRARAKQVS